MNYTFSVKYLFLAFVLFFITQNCVAQFVTCKDETKVNLGFPCPDPSFKPVCGCDGVTYRNICAAEMQNGILPGQWRDGSCSGLEFDIFPTYTDANINFSFIQNQFSATTAELAIIDQYGALMLFKSIYVDPSFCDGVFCKTEMLITETANYRQGVYIMFLYNGKGDYRFKKFVKY